MIDPWIPVVTAIIGAGTTIFTIWLKNKLEQQQKQDTCPVKDSIEVDEEVLDKLVEMQTISGCDRAAIYQFHNGGEYYTGKSMKKFSMTYETVSSGIARTQHLRQSIQVSACVATLIPLIHERRLFFKDIKKEYPESLCKVYLDEDGTQSTYIWIILDLKKRAIGFLKLDFVKSKKSLNKETIDTIELNTIKLAGYL